MMEYPAPNNLNSTVFNDLNQQSNIEQAVFFGTFAICKKIGRFNAGQP